MATMTFKSTVAQKKLERIRLLLREAPRHYRQLGEIMHMTPNAVQNYLYHLHGAGEIRIARYEHTGRFGAWAPVYALGSGKDAVRPTAKTNAEYKRTSNARLKRENPEKHRAIIMAKRAKRIKPRRDPMVAALFGEAT